MNVCLSRALRQLSAETQMEASSVGVELAMWGMVLPQALAAPLVSMTCGMHMPSLCGICRL
jgi:hypothetical protein